MESPRKSVRVSKLSYKMKDMQLRTPKSKKTKFVVESDESEESDSSEHEKLVDTVASNVQTPGKDIFTFTKIKKHERMIVDSPAKVIPKTPHSSRQKMKKILTATMQNNEDSSDENPFCDSGSEYSNSEDSSESESAVSSNSGQDQADKSLEKPKTTKNKPARVIPKTPAKKSQQNSKYVIKTEEYFANNANKKSTTSNHTLDHLSTPRLSQEQLKKLLGKLKISDQHEISMENQTNFSKWLCLLHEGFNIILYGLGSKKSILQEYHEQILADLPVIVINGFFPSLTIKDILDAVLQDCLELQESPGNIYDACDLIEEEFSLIPEIHLYLIVHNLDGDMLRNVKAQHVFTRLANVRNIHLIASIDHINAPLIWDHKKISKFNFIWWDVTSFLPYTEETSFESSMMVQKSGNLALSSLRNVFLSLTSNSKGIYLNIVKYQLEHGNVQYYQGLMFKDLYLICREAFLVSSDLALRAQLTEFVDHKMVKLRRSADGSEHLQVPIGSSLLQQFVNEQTK